MSLTEQWAALPAGGEPHAASNDAAAGAPILGDAVYGDPTIELRLSAFKRGYKGFADEKPLLRRLALHASELTFTHPITRVPHTLRAPLPHEFEVALKYLRKFAVA